MDNWEEKFLVYFRQKTQDDASHDISHFQRVYQTAKKISLLEKEAVDPLVIVAAAYFHDLVSLPKNDPNNHQSSYLSANMAKEILLKMDFPKEKLEPVCHAIHAHSFSAKIEPTTLEAKIIQDADRMEALGALGIMRTFYVSGRIGTEPYHKEDLFAKNRELDDKSFALDHFYCKLFKLQVSLQTIGGRQIAQKRTEFLHLFVSELVSDLEKGDGGALHLIKACRAAGRHNQKFFDAGDAFATKRPLNKETFVLDQFLDSEHLFIRIFLEQIKEEIL